VSATEQCKHEDLPPVPFDAEACKGKSASWVREHYPRVYSVCPKCREGVLRYASFEHYIEGDY
jgi:hypothetical protein